MIDLMKYLKIPYEVNGDSFSGADCYGIVYLYFKHELGINIPSFRMPRTLPSGEHNISSHDIENNHNDWDIVNLEDAKINDIVLFSTSSTSWHIGVIVDHNRIMHSSSRQGCSIVRISRLGRVHSVYRHKELGAE